jgi:hypothetical protein
MEGPFAPRVIRKAEICRAAPGWEVQTFINSLGGGRPITIMATVIDLAKSIFAMHGVDQAGAVYLRQPKVARAKLGAMIAALPPGMREMEACPGAHYWARQFQAQVDSVNHEVRSSDIHLGRLDGDECRCLVGQGCGSSGWLSLAPAD